MCTNLQIAFSCGCQKEMDFIQSVIHINRRAQKSVRSTITQPFKAPSTSLGRLEHLHLELIHEICLYLDIETLFRFRQVSRRAQQIVSTSRFYRETTTHALDALCALLRTKAASQFTLTELFTALCTRDCLLCNSSFGGFLFLPTLLRCCFSCVQKDRLPRLVPYADARWYISSKCKTASKTYRLLNSLSILRTIPGIYSMQEVSSKGRRQLVTMDDLVRVVGSRPTSDEEATWTAARSYANLPFMATTTLPYLDRASGRIEHGVCCTGCQVSLEEGLTKGMHFGADGLVLRDRVYSHEGFIGHFRECLKAQEVWKLRKNGTSVAKISEFVRRRGYFKERDVVMSFDRAK
ncbi:F-box protein [Aspergillus vadensis CBS 113365]|uniref:F-box domain-containing protein n=1 Tax=Aspergillus vadensis (strain CBS 113365 / IMI 142717 / IBT 24658) TaxID=1448311 RepID=A0A319BUE8_ASPVC|nr:F-box domain-containing protein [Aspergillus vadensis CBS 113365]PYH75149.1 F-box domain-containing protein [Aspergillus vadensis CBS 113365]